MHPFFESKPNKIYTIYMEESYGFPPHFHNNLEIVFCFSGCQKVRVGKTVYSLTGGDAVVIFPNNIHEYISGPCKNTKSASLIFSTSLLSDTVPEIMTHYPESPYIPASQISTDTSSVFFKLSKSEKDIEKVGLSFIILSELIEKLTLLPIKTNLSLPSMITSYIDANFTENLSINHLAKTFGYHPSYIAHIFCDQLKLPFSTYLSGLRCEYAAKQIRTTKKSLTEIAYDSGFNSLNTFCRCFKNHYDKTPSAYRKECRK